MIYHMCVYMSMHVRVGVFGGMILCACACILENLLSWVCIVANLTPSTHATYSFQDILGLIG